MGLKQTWIDKGNGPYIKKAGSRQAGRKIKITGSIIQRQVQIQVQDKYMPPASQLKQKQNVLTERNDDKLKLAKYEKH